MRCGWIFKLLWIYRRQIDRTFPISWLYSQIVIITVGDILLQPLLVVLSINESVLLLLVDITYVLCPCLQMWFKCGTVTNIGEFTNAKHNLGNWIGDQSFLFYTQLCGGFFSLGRLLVVGPCAFLKRFEIALLQILKLKGWRWNHRGIESKTSSVVTSDGTLNLLNIHQSYFTTSSAIAALDLLVLNSMWLLNWEFRGLAKAFRVRDRGLCSTGTIPREIIWLNGGQGI